MKKSDVVYLKNPWSGVVTRATWGDVLTWCAVHVHPRDRAQWLKAARQAVKDSDADTLGRMIIGA